MIANELEVVVLIPVFERQIVQWRCVCKFQIGKMPVEYLSIARRQIHIAGRIQFDFLHLGLEFGLQFVELFQLTEVEIPVALSYSHSELVFDVLFVNVRGIGCRFGRTGFTQLAMRQLGGFDEFGEFDYFRLVLDETLLQSNMATEVLDLFLFDVFFLQFDDPFEGLAERNGSVAGVIEVQLMRKVTGGFEETIEFPFDLIKETGGN